MCAQALLFASLAAQGGKSPATTAFRVWVNPMSTVISEWDSEMLEQQVERAIPDT
ncbi:hypothetical protein [Parendozoicomonas sp. Alg238-R29]|uniref:hypothetical protein n=1 Tax=Parendozoicomonas sp. Alg238-R29 TaxID=2993446 RepID=UPI00248E3EEA|nr:hypothetical protein [Parendozoicomonas sp. Alg238-R29]